MIALKGVRSGLEGDESDGLGRSCWGAAVGCRVVRSVREVVESRSATADDALAGTL